MRRAWFLLLLAALATGAALASEFGPDWPAVDTGGMGYSQDAPDIAINGNFKHIVFKDDRMGQALRYVRLTETQSIGLPVEIGPLASSGSGRIAFDPASENVYIVYSGTPEGIYLRRSLDNGVSWDDAVQVDDGTSNTFSHPDLTVLADGTVLVVWVDKFDDIEAKIMSDRSTNGGVSFGTDQVVQPDTFNDDIEPAIAADDYGWAYLVWTKTDGSEGRIHFSRTLDSGLSFQTALQVHPAAPIGYSDVKPDVTAWGDRRVVVAWSGMTLSMSDWDIIYRTSTDGGGTWVSSPEMLAHETGTDMFTPRLANDGIDHGLAVWEANDGGIFHVYFGRASIHMGSVDPAKLVDDVPNTYNLSTPAVANSELGFAGVVWRDMYTWPPHIFYDWIGPSFSDDFSDPGFSQWDVAVAVAVDATRSYDYGGTSARMGDSTRAAGVLARTWTPPQAGDISFYFWDGYPDPAYTSTDWRMSITYDDGAKAGVVRTLGVVNPSSTTHYSTSTDGGASWEVSGVPRALGWHSVEISVGGGGLAISVDEPFHSSSNPVLDDPTFVEFESVTFQGGSGTAPYNLDELTVDSEDARSVPAASSPGLALLAVALGYLAARRRRS